MNPPNDSQQEPPDSDGPADTKRFVEALARLQELFAHIPANVSLADELIAERREEARREADE